MHAIKQNDSKYNTTTYGTQCKQCCLTELQMQLYDKKTKYILFKFTGRNFHKSVVLYQNINIYTYDHDLHVINIIVTVVLISAGKQDFLLCHQWPWHCIASWDFTQSLPVVSSINLGVSLSEPYIYATTKW